MRKEQVSISSDEFRPLCEAIYYCIFSDYFSDKDELSLKDVSLIVASLDHTKQMIIENLKDNGCELTHIGSFDMTKQ